MQISAQSSHGDVPFIVGRSFVSTDLQPSNLSEGLGESVSIELDTDKPYVHSADHVKQYPPKKSGGASKKKMAKKGKK